MIKRFVAELTFVIDSIGTEQTFYAATSGFSTKPTDTPANAYIAPRLKSAGTLRRELFSGTRVTGAVRPSFGEIVLFNGDGGFDAWMGYGISGGKVTVRMGDEDAAYPAGYTTVYIAYAQHLLADFSEIRVRLRDRLNLLEKPVVTSSFLGTGGLEGTTAMAGKLKQWVSAGPGFFPPILIDPALQLYFVQSTGTGGLGAYITVHEGGMEITKGADYPDAATCLSTSPPPGQARFWLGTGGNGPVYFRLGSVPKYDLRVFGSGYQSSGATWFMGAFVAMAGIEDGADILHLGEQLIDDNRTYIQAMEDACSFQFGYFGMTRLDAFVNGVFNAPGVDPAHSFNQHNAKAWSRQPAQDMDAPVWAVNVNAGKTWKSNLVGGASATYKDYMSRDPWWSSFSEEHQDIKTANPGAVTAVVEMQGRNFSNAFGQSIFLDGYFARFGVRRDFYTCTVQLDETTIALELHDTVEIKLPRFGLDTGKNMRIITQQIDCDRREITYGFWG